MDSMDASLIEQALNYHGEQLQKIWEDSRGKEELSLLIVEKPNFEIYEQREKTLRYACHFVHTKVLRSLYFLNNIK